MSRERLLADYTASEVVQIKEHLQRAQIPENVIEAVIKRAAGVCCFCSDGNSARPFQIHHVAPYSETQDNSDENLLLVCPTHHVVTHVTVLACAEQKSVRRRWWNTVDLATDFALRGIPFPYGLFEPLDYHTHATPSELVEFSPLSPSTSLLCYSRELAQRAQEILNQHSFLLIMGASGSGKSTYAMALGGLYEEAGFLVFRHRMEKQDHSLFRHLSLFVSTCVRKAVLIMDDVNAWARSGDIQAIAKLVAGRANIRVIATSTSHDSEDEARLRAIDLPRQDLTFSELRPAVVEALLQHEGEVVVALKRFEAKSLARPLGVGYLDTSLKQQIRMLGDRAKTVYEFIFALRAQGASVAEELKQMCDADRSDVPILYLAIEQIGGFERSASVPEAVKACQSVECAAKLPPASADWVEEVFAQHTRERRLIRVRNCYTTIHRKWAARLIAAGLSSPVSRAATEGLLKPHFAPSADPARLLRLWSYLDSLDESRPFTSLWERSLSQNDWTALVKRCAETDLGELGAMAARMHLLRTGASWTECVGKAFEASSCQIARLIHSASEDDWYSLSELSMAMEHACQECLKDMLLSWEPENVAQLILRTRPYYFERLGWFFSSPRKLCPGWTGAVGQFVSWQEFQGRFALVEKGDLRSLLEMFGVFLSLGHKLRRSMVRRLAESMGTVLTEASLDDLRIPPADTGLLTLTLFFPDDARNAFAKVDARLLGEAAERSIPRHWSALCSLSSWARQCGSDVAGRIIDACRPAKLEQQMRRFGASNRYELRLLLHFLSGATEAVRRVLAQGIRDVVRQACQAMDSEARSIMAAYSRVDPDAAARLTNEIGVAPEDIEDADHSNDLQEVRNQFRDRDQKEDDYEISFTDDGPHRKGKEISPTMKTDIKN